MNMHEEKDALYRCIEEGAKEIKRLSAQKGEPFTFCVVTFGCQMNARDSEKLKGVLLSMGCVETESEDADICVYNTCTVRENANNKVYGRLGLLKKYKEKNPLMKIALCGCMMQEEEVVRTLKESYPFVDLIFGTHNLYRFPALLLPVLRDDEKVTELWDKAEGSVEDLPIRRTYSFKSGVNIMFGCNNFCSYCIVPYVRGRERSREPEEILTEIKALAKDGVKEIMLLGQNVNSYGRGVKSACTFPELLSEAAKVEGIERVRFMTSHPKDLSDELIEAMANSPKVCRHLHLPLQSGSDRLLELMNRHYTKAQYLSLVERLRERIPDIALTTDLIVGFPGETEEDFSETLDVVKRVVFDNAFTFQYSPRRKTPAEKLPGRLSEEVMRDRFDRLLALVKEGAAAQAKKKEGQTEEVLVESINRQDETLLTGRLSNNTLVHFKGEPALIGQVVSVRLDKSMGFYYLGEMV